MDSGYVQTFMTFLPYTNIIDLDCTYNYLDKDKILEMKIQFFLLRLNVQQRCMFWACIETSVIDFKENSINSEISYSTMLCCIRMKRQVGIWMTLRNYVFYINV